MNETAGRQPIEPSGDAPDAPRPRPWRGLSGKVLALTVLFVMVGEVLIFLPSLPISG